MDLHEVLREDDRVRHIVEGGHETGLGKSVDIHASGVPHRLERVTDPLIQHSEHAAINDAVSDLLSGEAVKPVVCIGEAWSPVTSGR